MALDLVLENIFSNNHIKTVLAQHTTKHQKDHISEFIFE